MESIRENGKFKVRVKVVGGCLGRGWICDVTLAICFYTCTHCEYRLVQ